VPEAIAVVGVVGEVLSKDAARALEAADLVVGATRHLGALAPSGAGRRLALTGDLGAALDDVAAEAGRVCVLASGDPGFFGIVRALAERFAPARLEVHPAPSSVSLAFARLGLPWDDATVVSAHGRPLADAARRAASAPKAAVLTAPDARPEDVGRELLGLGARHGRVVVCSRLGEGDEVVTDTDLTGLAAGAWDPLSVVVLLDGPAVAPAPVLAWGLPEERFDHRAGMVTKAEVRAVALGKLALPPTGVLWDVGAGSGSVAVECARLAPGLRVLAVERGADDAARARANAVAAGVAVEVVEGEAPACLAPLPDPDRAFVGGGGLAALDATLARLRPGGRAVATYAALDRAAAAFDRLGHLVELGVSRGQALPGGGVRLAAENPVFLAWGPAE
jgi:precorrin-6Y C5,15-methyltransferase (decarboxylating)